MAWRLIAIGLIKFAEKPGRNQHHGDGATAADQYRGDGAEGRRGGAGALSETGKRIVAEG
jgi:hypothetical protein